MIAVGETNELWMGMIVEFWIVGCEGVRRLYTSKGSASLTARYYPRLRR